MSIISTSAPVGLSAWFALIIDGLCGAVAAHAPRSLQAPLLVLVYGRLRRLVRRFARLVELTAGGTVPVPRVRAAQGPRAARTEMRLPKGWAWLVRLVPEAASFGSQLEHLLQQPEMVALIAAAPEVGRLVAPLRRMLSGSTAPKPVKTPPVVSLAAVAYRDRDLWPGVCGPEPRGQGPPDTADGNRRLLAMRR